MMMIAEGRLTRAIVRTPSVSFVNGLTTANLGAPDYAHALGQHAAYCDALEACGLKLTRLGADERYPDSTFVEDTAVMIGARANSRASAEKPSHALSRGRATAPETFAPNAILTRPGASSRAGEVESIAEVLHQLLPGQQLNSIREPGTLDGGDICEAECDAERDAERGVGSHFFIGVSERTNEAGARQLAELVAAYGCTSTLVDIRGMKGILHLKSGLAYLGDNRLVVIDALANHEAFRGYELVRVNQSEKYAANCLRLTDQVLVAAGYADFERTLQDLGYQTVPLEMSEFQKMDGGLSCLSLRF